MKRLFIQQLQQLATDRWARQGVRTLLRAATLAASIWCIWLGGHLLWGWPLRFEWMGALALMVIGFSVASLLRPRMTPEEAARRLDQRFHLDEQLSTALEIAATNPPPGSVAARLLAQSDYTAQTVAKSISRRQKPPWNDFLSLVVLLPVLIGLYILSGVSSTPQPAAPLPLPPLVAPGQEPPLPPFPPEQAGEQPGAVPDSPSQQEVPTSSNAPDPRVLEALADALRDQGATRPAADALDRGDLAGAAQELRQLADQADQLSQQTRNELADSLRDAAERIEDLNDDLADQLRRSAEGLEWGDLLAADALENLARAIENLPSTPQSVADAQMPGEQPGQGQGGDEGQGEQAGEGQGGEEGQGENDQGGGSNPGSGAGSGGGNERQSELSERLNVPGQPLELESEGPGEVPADPSDRPPTTSEVVGGNTQGGQASDQRVESGPDPLRVPIEERNVVQDYFQN
jgi:hypothetical protein